MDINTVPSLKLLSTLFDFPVPPAFVAAMKAFWKVAQVAGEPLADLMDDLCGFYLGGEDCRYQQTPPELFPIGRPGVDGVHYGYVIHTPERLTDDYPLGEFCPMDSDGVRSLGRNTREAFEFFLSRNLEREDQNSHNARNADLAARVADELGYTLSADRVESQYSNDDLVEPLMLPQERLVMTSDGIGVLADRQLFRPESITATYERMGKALEQARLDLEEGFPASALVYLREGYWQHWTEEGAVASYGHLMRQVYEALGRPQLADLVQRRTQKYA